MIGWIIFIFWLLSFIVGLVFGIILYFEREDWALIGLAICSIIFVGIPLLIILAIVQSGVEWYQELLQNILK